MRHLMPFAILLACFAVGVLLPLTVWVLWNPQLPAPLGIVILAGFPAIAIYLAWHAHRAWRKRALLKEILRLRARSARDR